MNTTAAQIIAAHHERALWELEMQATDGWDSYSFFGAHTPPTPARMTGPLCRWWMDLAQTCGHESCWVVSPLYFPDSSDSYDVETATAELTVIPLV